MADETLKQQKQVFYDKTCAHLVTQGCRAYGKFTQTSSLGVQCADYGCMYRTPDGKSCAIGCHIPDSEYDEKMENKNISTLTATYPTIAKLIPDLGLATELQSVHDFMEDWWNTGGLSELGKNRLQEIAVEHNLTPYTF